jgi:N-acyl-D-aspartate/D-glutamate deacylase
LPGRQGSNQYGSNPLVIRDGTIVDGAGTAAFTGDVAIVARRIAAVGSKLSGKTES